jgi:type I restriction enzyme, S subunit
VVRIFKNEQFNKRTIEQIKGIKTMKIKTNKYKQTKVGVIPEEWEVKKLRSLGKFSKGAGVRKDESLSGEIPCVRYGELYTKHHNYIKRFYSFISKDISLNAQRLKFGDILFAGSGETKEEIGKSVAFIDNFEAYAGGDIVILSPNNVEPLFLGYLLNAPFIQKQKTNKGQGDAVVHISATQLGKITIPIPPTFAEQTAISTALSDADALINSLEKLIAKKRLIKQAAMQKLLQPKKDWVVKKLGEICEITGAGVDKKINECEQNVRLLNYLDVYRRDYIYNRELNHTVTAPYSKTISCNVRKGDIFLTPSSELRTDIGVSAIAMEDMDGVVYSYHVYRLRYNIQINMLFGLYILKTKSFLDQSEMFCEGSGKRYVVSMSKFKNMTISFPLNIKEQTHIATILSDMDNEIQVLETKLEKYRKVKLGMMQNLLTGKIRLL